MNFNIYSVYDSKAECYTLPFYMKHEGEALRTFKNWANNPDHPIGQHPSDYTLFQIGTFDDEIAMIISDHVNSITNALPLQETKS
nr:MAG: nonstructural protein [Microvirus sp.]